MRDTRLRPQRLLIDLALRGQHAFPTYYLLVVDILRQLLLQHLLSRFPERLLGEAGLKLLLPRAPLTPRLLVGTFDVVVPALEMVLPAVVVAAAALLDGALWVLLGRLPVCLSTYQIKLTRFQLVRRWDMVTRVISAVFVRPLGHLGEALRRLPGAYRATDMYSFADGVPLLVGLIVNRLCDLFEGYSIILFAAVDGRLANILGLLL